MLGRVPYRLYCVVSAVGYSSCSVIDYCVSDIMITQGVFTHHCFTTYFVSLYSLIPHTLSQTEKNTSVCLQLFKGNCLGGSRAGF